LVFERNQDRMTRASFRFALACALALGAGCKDSTPNYIGFDAAQATDAKTDSPPSTTTDGGADSGRADASLDASTTDSHPIDAVAEAPPDEHLTDGDASDDTTADGDASDAEAGQ
jgi:hypothetical protein